MNFDHLIGKKIRHKSTGNIFVPFEMECHTILGGRPLYHVYTRDMSGYDTSIYVFTDDFNEHFEVIDKGVSNWRDKLGRN